VSQILVWISVPKESRNPEFLVAKGEQVSSLIILFAGAVVIYANYIYPDLEPIYGGGHKEPVLLMTNEVGYDVAAAAHLPVQPEHLVGPVQLLAESDKNVVVALPDRGLFDDKAPSVEIDRALIEAIAVQKENPAAVAAKATADQTSHPIPAW
jgi:hypothetical protein